TAWFSDFQNGKRRALVRTQGEQAMETWLYRLGQALGVSLLAVSLSGCQHAGAQAPAATSGATITLSGREEVPPVSTGAAGTGMIRVASDRTVSGKVTYSGVTATMAHIHH